MPEAREAAKSLLWPLVFEHQSRAAGLLPLAALPLVAGTLLLSVLPAGAAFLLRLVRRIGLVAHLAAVALLLVHLLLAAAATAAATLGAAIAALLAILFILLVVPLFVRHGVLRWEIEGNDR